MQIFYTHYIKLLHMFRAYILVIFRELQVRCGTDEFKCWNPSLPFFSVLKILYFVELHVSLNNVKLSSLMTKSRVTMGAVFKHAAFKQYSRLK